MLTSRGHIITIKTWDAFDFFTVSLTVTELAETFGKSKTDITWGITLVLMFRSVGSIAFGIASDRYGRKWPFIVNNILFIILELVSCDHPFSYLSFIIFIPVLRSCLCSMSPWEFRGVGSGRPMWYDIPTLFHRRGTS
jgi:SHS family lactate transporter-like MFS transporter